MEKYLLLINVLTEVIKLMILVLTLFESCGEAPKEGSYDCADHPTMSNALLSAPGRNTPNTTTTKFHRPAL